jgi:ParB/RepB/Spo0J family partition protein
MEQKISDKTQEEKEKTPPAVETKQASPEVIQNTHLSMIVCSPFNPRKYRNEEELEELAQSIINFGIIQPITLRMKGETYEIVCSERRYMASLKAGLSTIPAIVKNYSDGEAMEITILENLQRRDIGRSRFFRQTDEGARIFHRRSGETVRQNAAICIAAESFASAEVVNNLVDTGHEIYEIVANRLPEELQKPKPEQFESETEYKAAKASYESNLQRYKVCTAQIETLVEQGKAQFMVDVSRRKPELCYRMIPQSEAG